MMVVLTTSGRDESSLLEFSDSLSHPTRDSGGSMAPEYGEENAQKQMRKCKSSNIVQCVHALSESHCGSHVIHKMKKAFVIREPHTHNKNQMKI